jgi:hypothetical protein
MMLLVVCVGWRVKAARTRAAWPHWMEERRENLPLPPVHAATPPHYASSWSFWQAERRFQVTEEGRLAVVDYVVLIVLHLGLACRVFRLPRWQQLVL